MNPEPFDTTFSEIISAFANLIISKFQIQKLCIHIAKFKDSHSAEITHSDTYAFGYRAEETVTTERFAKKGIENRNPTGDKSINTLSVIYCNHFITITVDGMHFDALHGVAGILGQAISVMTYTK